MNNDTKEVLEALRSLVMYDCQIRDTSLFFPEYEEEADAIKILVKYGYAIKVSHEPLRYKLTRGET